MNDVVYVGHEGLMGEVIEIEGNITTIQVYEETSDVAPGEPVEGTGSPLSVDLGPGMLDAIYDGVQRPLDVLEEKMGSPYLDRGVDAPGIDLEKTWEFEPEVAEGDVVETGDIVGTVPETPSIDHKVMVPPGSEGGEVVSIESGNFTVEETVVELDSGEEIRMRQEWPVREQRPAEEKQTPTTPLVSGQRILDGLFPIAKGRTAAIPAPSAPARRSLSTSRQVRRRGHRRLRRLRRAGQRDDGGHRGLPRTGGPDHRQLADGPDVPHREHVEHARRGA